MSGTNGGPSGKMRDEWAKSLQGIAQVQSMVGQALLIINEFDGKRDVVKQMAATIDRFAARLAMLEERVERGASGSRHIPDDGDILRVVRKALGGNYPERDDRDDY